MNKKKKLSLLLVLGLLFSITFTIIQVKSAELSSGTHVFENDDLTYYINVYYDGKDVEGVESNDTTFADVRSGYIYVEDDLPEGLVFNGFIETSDGTIGAVKRSDGSVCQGEVIDGVSGLKYDTSTGKVTFTVRNLRAGCMLTVGVKTKTPTLADGIKRMDFCNTVSATEGDHTVLSETICAWVGEEETEEETKYQVVYQYSGTVPENASALPPTLEFVEGSQVTVASDAIAVGYTFSGWSASGTTISNGVFVMPASTVTLTGSFEQIPSYSVTYQIDGVAPEGYVIPEMQVYYEGMRVTLDQLKAGDIINGYRFLGWTSEDVTIASDLTFEMPADNVILTGSFEEVTYNVSYQFQGLHIPDNASSLLPETKAYKPGEIVTLEANPTASGYTFLGWYKENNFTMPNEDVVIYGEWAEEIILFQPGVSYSVNYPNKKSYRPGETISFKVTVTNNESYPIYDVMIKNHSETAQFRTDSSGYTITTAGLAKIDEIAAGKTAEVYLSYTVVESDSGRIESQIELIGALANGSYALDTSQDYTRKVNIVISSKVEICNTVDGGSAQKVFLYHMTGTNYDSWIVLGKNECKTVHVAPGSYKILEVIPQDYELASVTGDLTSNGGTLTVELGNDYSVMFNNKYNQNGFFHTFGRIENIIRGGGPES